MNPTKVGLLAACTTCLALAGSLAASVWAARYFYQERSALRLKPVDPAHFEQQNKALMPSGRRLVIFGDSRAQQLALGPNSAFGWQVINRGVSGESSVQSSYRFPSDVLALQPQATVIVTGINDLVAAANLPSHEREAVTNLKVNLTRFAKDASSLGGIVVVSTIVRPTSPRLIRRPFWSDRVFVLVDEVNEHIRAMTSQSIRVLDADHILSGRNKTLPHQQAIDEIHFSQHAIDQIEQALTELLGP
ncbi:GDSL-type esterase/lipase family protein [Xanthobacter flavus]|uniref:SGNH/GDSL hydrolase family protein n=1 Tax=Xanthobacter flavus TaxID=281 RepID=UPI003726A1B9